jgi:hypothetical protein
MTTTVYFATNRIANHPADRPENYTFFMTAPDNPLQVTYGTAFVDSAGLTADTVGAIRSLQDLQKGNFSQTAFDDLAEGGRNILVFIHGFANSFADALTRAAFNREWLSQSGVGDADTAVVTFSWPSRGQLLTFPFPTLPYRADQRMAGGSGLALMRFLANLLPILEKARANGRRTFLLTHSMGNLALQAAVQAWFETMTAPRPSKTHIGNHALHPETLMLSYGYDPAAVGGRGQAAGVPDLDLRVQFGRGGPRLLRLRLRPQASRQRAAGRGSSIRASTIPTARSSRIGSRSTSARACALFLVRHVGDLHHAARLRAAGRRDPAFAAALWRHRDAAARTLAGFGIGAVGFSMASTRPPSAQPAAEAAMGKGRVSVIMIETPANPTNTLVDIAS